MIVNWAPGVRMLEFKIELCCLLVGLYKESCLFFLDSAFLSVKWKQQQNPFHGTIKSTIELIYFKNLAQCLGHCKFSFLKIKFVYIIENIFSLWHLLTCCCCCCYGMNRENVEALRVALVCTNSFEFYVLVFQYKQVLYMFKTQSFQCYDSFYPAHNTFYCLSSNRRYDNSYLAHEGQVLSDKKGVKTNCSSLLLKKKQQQNSMLTNPLTMNLCDYKFDGKIHL